MEHFLRRSRAAVDTTARDEAASVTQPSDEQESSSVYQTATAIVASTESSSAARVFQPGVNLVAVIQALRFNSLSTLPGVRAGSDWRFELFTNFTYDIDVMNQVTQFEISVENGRQTIEFSYIVELGDRVSVALLEAMRTNKTVRELQIQLPCLTEEHLTAIEDSLLENDTLQSLDIMVVDGEISSKADVKAAFLRILERNMILQQLEICHLPAEDTLNPFPQQFPDWAPISAAISRNREAFTVARVLGQVSRSNVCSHPNFEDIALHRQLLIFFLPKNYEPPPMMLHMAKGLPNH